MIGLITVPLALRGRASSITARAATIASALTLAVTVQRLRVAERVLRALADEAARAADEVRELRAEALCSKRRAAA